MRAIAVFAVVLLGGVCWGQQSSKSFVSDSRLKAPITMRLKIVSLTDFTNALQKQTKVHFLVADDIANRKITTIFHDRPTSEVMTAVQDALFLEWKKAGDGYRLSLPLSVEREEEEIKSLERDAVKAGLIQAIRDYSVAASLSPEEKQRRLGEIKAQLALLKLDPSPEAQTKTTALFQSRSVLVSVSGAALCKTVADDPAAAADSLLAGRTLCASTRPDDSVPKLPQGYLDHLLKLEPEAQAAIAMMHFDTDDQTLQGESCVGGSPNRGNSVTDFFFYRPLVEESTILKDAKLIKRMVAWTQATDPKVMDKALAKDAPVEKSPGYFSHAEAGFTLADHLEFIADSADIPVVADAFRILCSPATYFTGQNVKTYVSNLQSSMLRKGTIGPLVFGYASSRNGWLMARHESFWRKLSIEIPEAVIQPLEQAAQIKDYPTADDYAQFVAGLTYDQACNIRDHRLAAAYRFDTFPFQDAMASLQLWATLTAEQKQAAATAGFKLTGLSNEQTRIILDGWADKMWRGRLQVSVWASFLSPQGIATSSPTLRYRAFDLSRIDGSRFQQANGTGKPLPVGSIFVQQGIFQYDLGSGMQLSDPFNLAKTHS